MARTMGVMLGAVMVGLATTVTAWGAGAGTEVAKVSRSTMAAADTIDGVPCAAGYVWRFADGRLHRCTLAHAATVRRVALPAGTTVAFRPDGTYEFVFLPETTTVDGYACRGAGHDFMTTFHPNGRLALCWMPRDVEVSGVPCAAFSIWSDVFGGQPSGVYLHDNGALASCRVSRDTTVGGTTFPKNSRIHLDRDGRLAAAR